MVKGLKKMKLSRLKIVLICILVGIAVIFLSNVFFKSSYIVPEHRRESWLKDINWNENRIDYSGKGITIAVIDTGIDNTVDEYKNNIVEELSVVNNKDKGNTEHGTAVTSIIVGYPKSPKGVLGVATGSSIISIDVTNDENGIVEVDNMIAGIEKAIERNVDIINLSVGCLCRNRNN